ncbi:MAG TPA: SGNH/GDSL hydrolase family protein, partial [Pirellulaceae bacterium]|nr:SGNH/GDSL hydrolase family protein [Pirellulaceae bacterium]
YLSFPIEYRSQFQNGYRALNLGNAGLATLALLLPVLGYGLRRLSLWVVAKAGDGLLVATDGAAVGKTEGASGMTPTVQSDTSNRSRWNRAAFAANSRCRFETGSSRRTHTSSHAARRRSSFMLTLFLAGVVHAGVGPLLDDLSPEMNGAVAQERSSSAANSSTSGAAANAAQSEKKAAPESELPESFPGKLRLRLPPVIQAVVGLETNLYFDNVILTINPANFAPDVICTKGKQQVERWTFTPVDADVGDHPLKLEFRDDENRLVARAVTTVRVVAADSKKDQELSLLLIGDSLTHASVYPQRLVELCKQPGNPKLTLVGSYGPGGMPGEVRHEGYGGWTAQRFATHFTGTAREGDYRMRGSPFLYRTGDAAPRLDFARYCADVNGGKAPDVVAVFLGPNDIFSLNDETLEAGLDNILKHYDQLREMVQTPGSTTKFAAMLPAPPAATQDAFGANYASGQTRWQYKRNQHRMIERLLEKYGGREAERIYVVPVHLNLDAFNNYPSRLDAPNLHAETKSVRLNNGVHPSAPGYRQIGDALYAWLKTQ